MNGERIAIDVAGETFWALTFGDAAAAPVLCLHGFPDHPPTFAAFATALSERGFRVIVPWLRGYAPSPLSGPVDVPALVGDARALLAAISTDTRARYLVGHDWGAVITYGLLAEGDPPVTSACAISLPHPVSLIRNALASAAQLARSSYILRFQRQGAAEDLAADDYALIRELWSAWSPGLRMADSAWSELRETFEASGGRPLDYYRGLRSRQTARYARRLRGRKIAVPTTTVLGADDGCIAAQMARGSQAHFAETFALEVLPACGHFLHAEVPELLATTVAAALALGQSTESRYTR